MVRALAFWHRRDRNATPPQPVKRWRRWTCWILFFLATIFWFLAFRQLGFIRHAGSGMNVRNVWIDGKLVGVWYFQSGVADFGMFRISFVKLHHPPRYRYQLAGIEYEGEVPAKSWKTRWWTMTERGRTIEISMDPLIILLVWAVLLVIAWNFLYFRMWPIHGMHRVGQDRNA